MLATAAVDRSQPQIDPREGGVTGLRVSLPEAANLLRTLGISVGDGDEWQVADE